MRLAVLFYSLMLCAASTCAAGPADPPAAAWYLAQIDKHAVRSATASLDQRAVDQHAALNARIHEVVTLAGQSKWEAAIDQIEALTPALRQGGPGAADALAVLLDFKGTLFQRQGQFALAVDAHQKALAVAAQLGSTFTNAEAGVAILNNLAIAYYFQGEFEKSEQQLGAIIANQGISNVLRAKARNNRGLNYAERGQHDKALLDFTAAEAAVRRMPKEPRLLAEILNNAARLAMRQENWFRADQALPEALALADQLADLGLKAAILDSWAESLVLRGQHQAALAKLDEAEAAERKASTPLVHLSLQLWRARALAGLGRHADALPLYRDAAESADSYGMPALMRLALAGRAASHAALGRLDEAVQDYAAAISVAENTRARLTGEDEASFIDTTAALYADTVTVLLKRNGSGDAELALSMLERSKSAQLQGQLAAANPTLRDQQAQRDLAGTRGVLRQETALAQQLQQLLGTPKPDAAALARVRQQLAQVRAKAVAALGELNDTYQGRYNLFVPAAIDPKIVQGLSQRLPPNSLLISYALADDGIYIFLTSRDGKVQFRQNRSVNRVQVEQHIDAYRAHITEQRRERLSDWRIDSWSDAAWATLRGETEWLYQQLLAPIADDLAGVDQLIFAPTGRLYYLPMHALGMVSADGRHMQYLVQRHKISYVAPGSLVKALDRGASPTTPKLLAFGDVSYGAATHLQTLQFSKVELAAMRNIFGKEATVLAGPQAKRDTLLAALAGNAASKGSPYRYVLLSTHGILNDKEPRSSYLALEGESRLSAQELGGFDLRGVRVLALSACETALAARHPGTELMSLGEYASAAGAAAVLSSLWQVEDRATAHLMSEFFSRLKQSPDAASAALRGAVLTMTDKPETTHPFFWAPFVLYGKGW
jgi:CHAT domain-containing protein